MKNLLSILALFSLVSLATSAERKPNILVIVGDDMGYADISAHGSKDLPTPHIDSLGRNGVRCSSGYVSGPYCSPTRAGLMTGRYQNRFGHEFNPGPAPTALADFGLPLTETALPQRLKSAGYRTGMVGKWHLGYAKEFHPLSRGFDEFFGFLGGAHSYLDSEADQANPILRGFTPVAEQEYLTDAFRREAVTFLDRHKDEPWFLYWTFNAVHTPMHTIDKYLQRFPDVKEPGRQKYCAMMAAMDDAIGAVLEKLREQKLEEHTLIFFVSDNGGPPANSSSNGSLRGHKAQTWEGGVRVPYLVQWKGRLPAGKVYDQPVIQLDFLPTALAAAGVAVRPEWKIDGVNLLPFFRGEQTGAPHAALYWRFGQQLAIRMGDWKLVRAAGIEGVESRRKAGDNGVTGAQLFNLAKDLGEKENLAAREPQKLAQLTAAWQQWNSELLEPRWVPNRNANAKKKNKAEEEDDSDWFRGILRE